MNENRTPDHKAEADELFDSSQNNKASIFDKWKSGGKKSIDALKQRATGAAGSLRGGISSASEAVGNVATSAKNSVESGMAELPWMKMQQELVDIEDRQQAIELELFELQAQAKADSANAAAILTESTTLNAENDQLIRRWYELREKLEQSLLAQAHFSIEKRFKAGKAKWLAEMAGYSVAGAVVGVIASAAWEAAPPTVKKSVADALIVSGFTVAGLATAGEFLQKSNNGVARAVGKSLHKTSLLFFQNLDRIAGFGVGLAAGASFGPRIMDGLQGMFDGNGGAPSSENMTASPLGTPTPEPTPTLSPVQEMTMHGYTPTAGEFTPTPVGELATPLSTPGSEPIATIDAPLPTPTTDYAQLGRDFAQYLTTEQPDIAADVSAALATPETVLTTSAPVETAIDSEPTMTSPLLGRVMDIFNSIFGPTKQRIETAIADGTVAEYVSDLAQSVENAGSQNGGDTSPAETVAQSPQDTAVSPTESAPSPAVVEAQSQQDVVEAATNMIQKYFEVVDGKVVLKPEYADDLAAVTGQITEAINEAKDAQNAAEAPVAENAEATQSHAEQVPAVETDYSSLTPEQVAEAMIEEVYGGSLPPEKLNLLLSVVTYALPDDANIPSDYRFAQQIAQASDGDTVGGFFQDFTDATTGETYAILLPTKSAMEKLFEIYDAAMQKPAADLTAVEKVIVDAAQTHDKQLTTEELHALFVIAIGDSLSEANDALNPATEVDGQATQPTAETMQTQELQSSIWNHLQAESGLPNSTVDVAKDVVLGTLSVAEDGAKINPAELPGNAKFLTLTSDMTADDVSKLVGIDKGIFGILPTPEQQQSLHAALQELQQTPVGERDLTQQLLAELSSGQKLGQDLNLSELNALFAILRGQSTDDASQLLPTLSEAPAVEPVAEVPVNDPAVDLAQPQMEQTVVVSTESIHDIAGNLHANLPEGVGLSQAQLEESVLAANGQANTQYEIRNVATGEIVESETIHPGDTVTAKIEDGKVVISVHKVWIEGVREQQGRWDGTPIVASVEIPLESVEGVSSQQSQPVEEVNSATQTEVSPAAEGTTFEAPNTAEQNAAADLSVQSESVEDREDAPVETPATPAQESAQDSEPENSDETASDPESTADLSIEQQVHDVVVATGLDLNQPEAVESFIQFYADELMGQELPEALEVLKNTEYSIKFALVADETWNTWVAECQKTGADPYTQAPTEIKSPARALIISIIQHGNDFAPFEVKSGNETIAITSEDISSAMNNIANDPVMHPKLMVDRKAPGAIAYLNQLLYFGTDEAGEKKYNEFVNPSAVIDAESVSVATTEESASETQSQQRELSPSGAGEMPLAAHRNYLISPESIAAWADSVPSSEELYADLREAGVPEDRLEAAYTHIANMNTRQVFETEMLSMAKSLFPGNGLQPNLQAINDFRSKFGIEGPVTPQEMARIAFAASFYAHPANADGSYTPIWNTDNLNSTIVSNVLAYDELSGTFKAYIRPEQHFTYAGASE